MPYISYASSKSKIVVDKEIQTSFKSQAAINACINRLTVKAVTLIFISGCGSAISSPKEGKSGFIYNLVKK